MSLLALALAATLAGQSAPDPNTDDARCIAVVALMIAQAKDDQEKTRFSAGLMYFLGRIDTRTPGYDLEAALRRILDAVEKGDSLSDDAIRCGGILRQRGQYMIEFGQRMQNGPKN
ncbi:hypothetical protein [Sphingomonas sp. G-3-2-10]|uniref:hypothetical protein n=1 Tax=Sphingomonas sp. G-3-2-10 TaxID=2728838 RepID=UPI00146D74A0|nr:hypothetical protein [Sphingomonas sp. G-3-2-10]NML07344.1 hypothetical protein [Sphingomonas sp. G-3-2-10]